jgi:hypothetical protein
MLSRLLLAAAAIGLAAPAFAASGWSSYTDKTLGYTEVVPPGFVGEGADVDGGNGETFSRPRVGSLRVWGGLPDKGFKEDLADHLETMRLDGWVINNTSVADGLATYLGHKGDLLLYARTISTCSDHRYATFELTYTKGRAHEIAGVPPKLDAGLKQANCK